MTKCKHCNAGHDPELSPHTNTWIHRFPRLDKPCNDRNGPFESKAQFLRSLSKEDLKAYLANDPTYPRAPR